MNSELLDRVVKAEVASQRAAQNFQMIVDGAKFLVDAVRRGDIAVGVGVSSDDARVLSKTLKDRMVYYEDVDAAYDFVVNCNWYVRVLLLGDGVVDAKAFLERGLGRIKAQKFVLSKRSLGWVKGEDGVGCMRSPVSSATAKKIGALLR